MSARRKSSLLTSVAPVRTSEDGADVPEEPFFDTEPLGLKLTARAALARAIFVTLVPKAALRAARRGDPIVVLIEIPNVSWSMPLVSAIHAFVPKSDVIAPMRKPGKHEKPENVPIEQPTFVIASDLDWLAPALIAAADIRLESRLTPEIVETALKLAFGRRAKVEALDLIGLDFMDVAAAIRPRESALKAVVRIKKVASGRADATAAGLGDAPLLSSLVGYGDALDTIIAVADDARILLGEDQATAVLPSILLHGAPGTGKTQLVKSFARSLNLPLVSTSVASWFSSTDGALGDVLHAAQKVFDEAASRSPCVLFMDELDALPNRSTMSNRGRDWWLPVITGVLLMIDRIRMKGVGVILVGATNYRDAIDEALRRPGRLDVHLQIKAPATVAELANVMRHHLRGALDDVDITPAAQAGLGATGAQAAGWVRQAKSVARRDNRAIELHDLLAAVAPPDDRSDEERLKTAIHEAGHAIVGRVLGLKLLSVNILSRGNASGLTTFETPPAVFSLEELERQVVTGLAGRAADEILSGAATSGAVGDLRKATHLLSMAHGAFGLGPSLISRFRVIGADEMAPLDPQLLKIVERDLDRLMNTARALVREHSPLILTVADWLVEHRVATALTVEALANAPTVDRRRAGPRPSVY